MSQRTPPTSSAADALWLAALGAGALGHARPMDLAAVDEALALGEAHSLDALTARGLVALGADADDVREAERARVALVRAMVLGTARRALTEALVERGVAHVFLKGGANDAFLGGRGLRGSKDLDVLVRRGDAVVVEEWLRARGYELALGPSLSSQARVAHGASWTHDDPLRFPDVDVHIRCFDPPAAIDVDGVLARARQVDGPEGSFLALCLEDGVVFAAGNFGVWVASRAKNTLDVALHLRCPLDLGAVVVRARRSGAATPLWALLRLAEARFGTSTPRWVMRDLAPRSAAHRRAVERAIGLRAPAPAGARAAEVMLREWPLSGRWLWPLEVAVRRGAHAAWDLAT